jgi:hypothetical protein
MSERAELLVVSTGYEAPDRLFVLPTVTGHPRLEAQARDAGRAMSQEQEKAPLTTQRGSQLNWTGSLRLFTERELP